MKGFLQCMLILGNIWQSFTTAKKKAVKLQNKALLISSVFTNAFHATKLFLCFSRYQVPTSRVAHPTLYKPLTTNDSPFFSDEGQRLEAIYDGRLKSSTQLIRPHTVPFKPGLIQPMNS